MDGRTHPLRTYNSRLTYEHLNRTEAHVANVGNYLNQIGPSDSASEFSPFLTHFPKWLVPGKKGVRFRQEEDAKIFTDIFD